VGKGYRQVRKVSSQIDHWHLWKPGHWSLPPFNASDAKHSWPWLQCLTIVDSFRQTALRHIRVCKPPWKIQQRKPSSDMERCMAEKRDSPSSTLPRSAETHDEHCHSLPALANGDRCYIQNQTGNYPRWWDRSGTVVESHGYNSYTVKVDGTSRVMRRNRKYLWCFLPASPAISPNAPTPIKHIDNQPKELQKITPRQVFT